MCETVLLLVFLITFYPFGDTNTCEDKGQLSCGEGSLDCYYKAFICDGSVDCADTGKDEMNCDTHTCAEDEFQCTIGHCIPGDRRCNHIIECHDSSDEDDCNWSNCNDDLNEFKCVVSGKCLTEEQRCDGTYDCGGHDTSDETDCGGPCDDGKFHCSIANICIDSKWRCDGVTDCEQNEDELGCPSLTCTHGLLCDGDTRCVHDSQICDQRLDCIDEADEDPSRCGCDGGVLCTNGACIPESWRCDGANDCNDSVPGGTDEFDCNKCGEMEFQCPDTSCINSSLVCNDERDCFNSGADEEYCLKQGVNCTDGFSCLTNKKCIPNRLYCDGEDHCGDGSDEVDGCVVWDPCSVNNGGCQHSCETQPNSTHVCTCNSGFELAPNGLACVDINECDREDFSCSQFCTNTVSSYYCSCAEGYHLDPVNRRSCLATEVEPYIVFSNMMKIRRTNVLGKGSKILFETNHSNIIDFDYRRKVWYWVDITEQPEGRDKLTPVILKRFFNKTGKELVYKEVGKNHEILDMAVDWITNTLYIVAKNLGKNGSITAASVQTNRSVKIASVDMDVGYPRAIALDPRDGLVFWSVIHASEEPFGRIESSGMDGSDRKVLASNVGWVNGITIDYARRRVVWIDAGSGNHSIYTGRIEEMDYSGGNRRVIKYLKPHYHRPWGLSMFEDYYYWTDSDSSQQALLKSNRFNTTVMEAIRRGLQVPMSVKVVHPLRQPLITNPCHDNSCSHMCVLSPGGAVCICPEGLILQNDTVCVAPTYEVVCPSCPPSSPCVRLSSAGYGCVTQDKEPQTKDKESSHKAKAGTISWWIILIIVFLFFIVVVIGIFACKPAFRNSCKPCLNRLGQGPRQHLPQDYMQISLQPTSGCPTIATVASDSGLNKKESDI